MKSRFPIYLILGITGAVTIGLCRMIANDGFDRVEDCLRYRMGVK